MPFDFPTDYQEVQLRKSPLNEVICQVRFAPILRIGFETPSKFQDLIRERLPNYEIEQKISILPPVADTQVSSNTLASHHFLNHDGTLRATLNIDSFALTTTKYEHWNKFHNSLLWLSETVQSLYDIQEAARIGLRYVNVVSQDMADHVHADHILDLVRPELSELIRTQPLQNAIRAIQRVTVVDGSDKLTIAILWSELEDSESRAIILDFDMYIDSEITPLSSLEDISNRYHDVIYQAFRWSLSENYGVDPFDPES
ncbi:TIGR04255 family protein [Chloroflexi bacterium TSY]|nr:TIGR04255 family protein [Chloroflexi bacterium TSY]